MTDEDAAARSYIDYQADTPELAASTWAAYQAIQSRLGDDWIGPDIGCSNDGDTFGFYWDDGTEQVSVSVEIGQPVNCFYRDRRTENIRGDDCSEDGGPRLFPEWFVDVLRLIIGRLRARRQSPDVARTHQSRTPP